MRIPLDWLKEYLPDLKGRGIDKKISPDSLADKLTMSGTEVEVLKSGLDLDEKIIVGEILEVKKHPNADRLNIADVKVGPNRLLKIVCGGTNLEAGQKVPVATI